MATRKSTTSTNWCVDQWDWFGGFLSVVNVALANWILLTFLLVVLVSLL